MNSLGQLDKLPRAILAHTPTPLEAMPNLAKQLGKGDIFVKRDDCTGLGTGGNKVRQLEFYLGKAIAANADTILITGAVQSNFARLAVAAARKNSMECHIQLEHRVANPCAQYNTSGNIFLSQLFGAKFHEYADGEDESGADENLETIAAELKSEGKTPYVIHLGAQFPPVGALGYVVCARELISQIENDGLHIDEIFVASGSGATHAGLLFGLRALGCNIPVKGICVRREISQQRPRIAGHCEKIAEMLKIKNPIIQSDIELNDDALAPGYGIVNDAVLDAIELSARMDAILLDPVYTGRVMAGMLSSIRNRDKAKNSIFIHTGGQAALFGYSDDLTPILERTPL